jgi:hypothetical protein
MVDLRAGLNVPLNVQRFVPVFLLRADILRSTFSQENLEQEQIYGLRNVKRDLMYTESSAEQTFLTKWNVREAHIMHRVEP